MALSKLFQRIFWHNNTTPAINEDNLNAMSKAIDDIDNRVIALGDDVMTVVPQIAAYLEQAEDLVEAMELLSENPPYIGSNGNWYVWDTNTSAFVDSGVDASITVNIADITMLDPSATPYVTNSGTATDPVFHLFIPRGQTGQNGVSPAVTITPITGGHRVTITDASHPSGQSFDVMDGDMAKSVYDPNGTIASAGGMKSAAAKNSTNAVTANSTDLVESGAVYAKTEPLWDNMMDNGAVNLLENSAASYTDPSGEVTWTVNSDGTVTAVVNQTTTETRRLSSVFSASRVNALIEKFGTLKLTGSPSNKIDIYGKYSDNTYFADEGTGTIIDTTHGTVTQEVRIQIEAGTTPQTFVIKPMLSDPSLNLSYNDYVPYAKTNRELTEETDVTFTASANETEIVSYKIKKRDGHVYGYIDAKVLATSITLFGTLSEKPPYTWAQLACNSTSRARPVGNCYVTNSGEIACNPVNAYSVNDRIQVAVDFYTTLK